MSTFKGCKGVVALAENDSQRESAAVTETREFETAIIVDRSRSLAFLRADLLSREDSKAHRELTDVSAGVYAIRAPQSSVHICALFAVTDSICGTRFSRCCGGRQPDAI